MAAMAIGGSDIVALCQFTGQNQPLIWVVWHAVDHMVRAPHFMQSLQLRQSVGITGNKSHCKRALMGKSKGRIVYKNEDGDWLNKKIGATRAASRHGTQKEAESEARRMLQNSGGGELITKGVDGKIRSKDTIAPGNDPCPPRDKEH